jgi:beta-galactosidase
VALDDPSLSRLLARVTAEAGVEPVCPVTWSDEVDVTRRSGPGGSWLFVLNHGSKDVDIAVTGHDLVDDEPVAGRITVGAGRSAVIREHH